MFKRVLIANRGEIACRIIRTLKKLGCETIAVYSEEDAHSLHVQLADQAFLLGPAAAKESYLDVQKVLAVAKDNGVEAIHPGYGFLSENTAFAEACETAGIAFIGPTPENIRAFGLKNEARTIAKQQQVPLVPGTELLENEQEALEAAAEIGYPVMLKSVAGGGGIGLQRCDDPEQLKEKLEAVRRLSEANFGQSGVFLEKFIVRARHIEAQIFGDGKGKVVALGERDCSTQRRNQKVIEETPAPNLDESTRQQLLDAAVKMGEAVHYRSAGTVEFVCDADSGQFYFLEVNTRLQVEHGVTELVTGIDLVEWMVRLAAGETLPFELADNPRKGWAIQARLYAEDANKNFQPSSGRLINVSFPESIRCDSWIENGTEVSPFYDPLLAKVLVHSGTREAAVEALQTALQGSRIDGIETNLPFLRTISSTQTFVDGTMTTGALAELEYHPRSVDIITPGLSTSIQDYPGRVGYWMPGIPPSGPMDSLAFRMGNRMLGNDEGAPGLELSYTGPQLRFNSEMKFCLTGASCEATLDGVKIENYQAITASIGSVLKVNRIGSPGCRTYLLFEGGLDVPETMGSSSTFAIGEIGGLAGRVLRAGDVLHILQPEDSAQPTSFESGKLPAIQQEMHIGVLYGPHAAPEFFKYEDIETFLNYPWEVHHNSDRTGIRLIGPKPKWARPDGGEAGLHPSNIHDTMYALGAIDFTGDMPIILGQDGPSQGGFSCPVVIASAERWKMGQLRAGMKVRFHIVSPETAIELQKTQDAFLEGKTVSPDGIKSDANSCTDISSLSDIYHRLPAEGDRPEVTYRLAGDNIVLIEYGPMKLDLVYRFRVQALLESLEAETIEGIEEASPAVRSLQVIYDNRRLTPGKLVEQLVQIEQKLPAIDNMVMRSRIVKLPLSWNDPQAVLAMTKYTQSVRDSAPWCPDNIEFIRRVNGLESKETVKEIVYGATYLVLGLGNVYLGAPCTTPLDPRHRLVTTKYNPARTWTPENAVGIGGSYLGIYGMEGPGGYQLVGRTCQMFNRYRTTKDFPKDHPWLLNAFDQIQFYPVSKEELLQIREDFLTGKFQLEVEETEFRPAEYLKFLESIAEETAAFETKRDQSFQAERDHWEAIGEFSAQAAAEEAEVAPELEVAELNDGESEVTADMTANVWKILVKKGEQVKAGDTLTVLEAMKMELPITAETDGMVSEILCEEGKMVAPGQRLMVFKN